MAKDTKDKSTIDWYDEVEKVSKEETEAQDSYFNAKDLKPSEECVKLIEEFEGFRSEAYQDSVGVWTIGFGSTRGVKPGDTITHHEAKERMLEELDRYYATAIRIHVKVPVTQSMFDSMCSFCYNVGQGNFSNSTLLKKLNKEDYQGSSEEFTKWVYAGGKQLAGLVRRRKAERALFEGNDWREYT